MRIAARQANDIRGFLDRQDQEQGLSLGADAYIVKRKFDQQEILNTIRQLL